MTTRFLQRAITVTSWIETSEHISITYNYQGKEKYLIITKAEDKELMQHVHGPVCQIDAINLCIAHEGDVRKQVQHIDMAKVQKELRNN